MISNSNNIYPGTYLYPYVNQISHSSQIKSNFTNVSNVSNQF